MAGRWLSSVAAEDWYAEVRDVDSRPGFGAVERDELGAGGIEADLESFDLAHPAVMAGFGDAVAEIADDRDKAWALLRVDAHHGAAEAGVLVLAGAAVGSSASAQFQLAQLEMCVELAPFGVGGFAVLGLGPDRSALIEESAVGADQVVLEDCGPLPAR